MSDEVCKSCKQSFKMVSYICVESEFESLKLLR